MTLPWATLGGERITRGRVYVPGIGVWYAELEMEAAPDLSGRQILALGELRMSGTIDASSSGTSALVAMYQLVGGGAGWSKVIPARSYHSDAGVRVTTVAQDAAREAGETLGTVRVPGELVGADYVRGRGAASVTLADVAAGVPWWVDFDGTTHVQPREESQADPDTYEVLEVDPADRLVTLAVDDLTRIGIGSILTERLDAPLTIRSMEIEIDGAGAVRVRAWCGAPSTSESRLGRALRGFVRHVNADRLLGVWSYQVVRQSGARLELQPVERSAGLPDVGPVDVWTGVAGASSEVASGTQVLVEFIDGNRRKPIVRGFAPKGGSGHVPLHVVLAASSTIKLGDESADDGVAKSSASNGRFDSIAAALDALCSTPPTPNDGGASLQVAVRAAWAPTQPGALGVPPVTTPAADVGSTKVFVE